MRQAQRELLPGPNQNVRSLQRTRPSKSLIPAVSGGILTSLPISEYRPVQMDDLDPHRTETQKEWKDWADHGYRKMYQPRSMLWFGGAFFTLLAAALVAIAWLASTGRWP
jgi:hypothetical protein